MSECLGTVYKITRQWRSRGLFSLNRTFFNTSAHKMFIPNHSKLQFQHQSIEKRKSFSSISSNSIEIQSKKSELYNPQKQSERPLKNEAILFTGLYFIVAELVSHENKKFQAPLPIIDSKLLSQHQKLHKYLFSYWLKKELDEVFVLVEIPKVQDNQSESEKEKEKEMEKENLETEREQINSLTFQSSLQLSKHAKPMDTWIPNKNVWDKEGRWTEKSNFRSQRSQILRTLNSKEKQLEKAVESSNPELVFSILEHAQKNEIDLNVNIAPHGGSFLHLCAARGDIETAKLLIHFGAHVDVRAKNEATPLHWASGAGYLDFVKMMVEKGADVHAVTNSWHTDSVFGKSSGQLPLHWAAEAPNFDIVKYLLEVGTFASATDERGATAKDVSESDAVKEEIKKAEDRNFVCFRLSFQNSNGLASHVSDFNKLISMFSSKQENSENTK